MCESIYIGNTHHIFKKRMYINFYYILRLLKNGQKLDSFDAHSKQHFNYTTSHTDPRNYITFKLVKQLNPIGAMKTFTKPNCSLCTEEHITTLKNLRYKCITVMNNNSEIYGAYLHKTTPYQFFLSNNDTV